VNGPKLILSSILILISAVAFIGFVDADVTFQDTEVRDFLIPQDQSWGSYGTHDNTLTNADDDLVIDDTATGEGYFYGDDVFYDAQGISLNRVIVETNFPSPTKHSANLTINVLEDDGTIFDTITIPLEDGRISYSLSELDCGEGTGFDFEYHLTTGDASSPEIISMDVESSVTFDRGGDFPELLPILIFSSLGFIGVAGIFNSL